MALALSDEPVVIERVFAGEDADAARRGGKRLVARSECRFDCHDDATLARCIKAIKQSDEALRNRSNQAAFYDWQSPLVVRRPEGGGVMTFGVAWYDETFFEAKRDVYLGALHNHLFERIGLQTGSISISHWKLLGEGVA